MHKIKLFLTSLLAAFAVFGATAAASQAYLNVDNAYEECNYEAYSVNNLYNLQARFPNWQVRLYRQENYRYESRSVFVAILYNNPYNNDNQRVNCRFTADSLGTPGVSFPPFIQNVSFRLIWPN